MRYVSARTGVLFSTSGVLRLGASTGRTTTRVKSRHGTSNCACPLRAEGSAKRQDRLLNGAASGRCVGHRIEHHEIVDRLVVSHGGHACSGLRELPRVLLALVL